MRRTLSTIPRLVRAGVPARNLTYTPPLRDVKFLFNDVFKMQDNWNRIADKYNYPHLKEDCSEDVVESIFEAAGTFAVNELLPLYQLSDVEGVKYDGKDQRVSVTPGFEEAYKKYSADGWNTIAIPSDLGGQGLPMSVNMVKTEFMATANWAWGMFPGLTLGAMNTLLLHGSLEQKQKYIPKLASGEWSGTMCLTEPHCGTDLAQNKTRAEPIDERNGVYKLTGTKIFISCGDHEIADNIIHIVLARLPNSPAGTKGISLFIVPKYTEEELAKPVAERKRNVICAGIEKKMGIHGSPTCVMSFENSVGYLIGLPNDGLRQMFTFMNTARLGVALQGVAHAELAFQNAYNYAIERTGMSPMSGRVEPTKPADSIIHLPEIKRLLMTARVVADAGRHIVFKCAYVADEMMFARDKKIVEKLEHEVGWYTPVAKGFVTEMSMEAVYDCMQVLGGHGYIRDHGLEQIYRDARIGTMYEGTTAIQGLDLIGRKMFLDKFRLYKKYIQKLIMFGLNTAKESGFSSRSGKHGRALASAAASHARAIAGLAIHVAKSKQNRDALTSNSVDNLFALGFLMFGEALLEQRAIASKKLKKGGAELSAEEKMFLEAKVLNADFFFERMFPRVHGHIGIIRNSDKSVTFKNYEILPRM